VTEALHVNLPAFQGPLDLLLHLVRRNEMDIYDIPIATLADRYLESLATMEDLDLEVAGEFLVMATTLLEIKSRMLLPTPPREDLREEEDPRAELTRRLLEYEAFKEAAEQLRSLESFGLQRFLRGGMEASGDYPTDGPRYRNATPDRLWTAFQRMLEEAARDGTDPAPVARDRWTVSLKMRELGILLHRFPEGVRFHECVAPGATRLEIIVTFLAVLEMLKRGRLKLSQRRTWGDIKLVGVVAS
jgi:segregation and condensation protein A